MKLKQLSTHLSLRKFLRKNLSEFINYFKNKKYFLILDCTHYKILRTELNSTKFNLLIYYKSQKYFFKGVRHFYIEDNILYFGSYKGIYRNANSDLESGIIVCKYDILKNKLYYSDSIRDFFKDYKLLKFKNFHVFEYKIEEYYEPGHYEMLITPKIHNLRLDVDKLAYHEYLIDEDNNFTHDKLISLGAKDIKLRDIQGSASIPNKFFE